MTEQNANYVGLVEGRQLPSKLKKICTYKIRKFKKMCK